MNSSLETGRWCFLPALAFTALALLTGCGTTPYAYPDAQATNAAPAIGSSPVSVPAVAPPNAGAATNQTADQIQPGVKLTVIFSGIPNPPPKHEEKVREDGYISPPYLVRPVKAAGKTIGKLQEELQTLYVPDYFTRALTVTVTIEERWFYVGGEVKNGNRYIYSGEITVLKAIQTAGGFTEFARRSKVQVTRANGHKEKPVNCDKAIFDSKLDLPIYPGDQIFVRKRLF